MINIHLLDGNIRSFEAPLSGLDIAKSISKSLAKKAIAIKLNGALKDLDTIIKEDAKIEIVTSDSSEGLEVIRHDAAHVLAQAVKELFPEVQVTIGPVIENGFYYDFAKSTPFHTEDLQVIEKKMLEIIHANQKIIRKVVSKKEAIEYFKSIGEFYKIELIEAIPDNEEVSIYWQGDFADLCRGPHSPSTCFIKAFKLMKISGSYWRGDSKNSALQRIYGTAWATTADLDNYLHMLEEAEKRDHRKLGKEMDLFHFQEEAPGAVFWHPKGWKLFQTLVNYMRLKQDKAGYLEISTPEIMDKCLWEESGHWEKFGDNMFTAHAADEKVYTVRPMNCPGGIQVFKHGIVSYRDLPLRLSEFGKVHRYEPSGSLHGLMRVRAFTQDDAHIFCTEDQLQEESLKVCQLVFEIYKDFGFDTIRVKFSTRPEKRLGSDEIWDKSETALLGSLQALGVEFTLNPGEGAFYGPKLEFVLRDAIGRDWQLGTLQVDQNLPGRLGAYYTGQDGNRHHSVMLHRALFGSLERFIGILIEHYAGKLPLWLAPIKVAVITITSDVADYANEIATILADNGVEHIVDTKGETLNYKIKQYSSVKIPIILIVGRNETKDRTASIRRIGSSDQQNMNLSEFITQIVAESRSPVNII
ncbi:MAG: threonine--tRNA ligase [Candidatus Midichloria sp.]|uniref:threonine--tRNA ligase n=1 Tax=Hyalomma marginatum TaxID=34627 RepID=A0A8S4BWR5_9ACAR|nr:threonine--tRNA ligase [Hyalomma marginatum]CAG7600456.1 threonine--tRNA ligase [Hyalomma marginatum]